MENNHILVVLDAARYDVFNNTEFEYFPNNALKAYTPACWTLPSFFSMFLGYSPANAERWDFLTGEQAHWLPKSIQDEGYYTAFHSGSAWLALPHLRQLYSLGFDEYDIDYRYQERAQEYVWTEFDDEPFFHTFHYLETHHPFMTGEEKIGMDEIKEEADSEEEARERLKEVHGKSLKFVDSRFGKMLGNIPDGTIITLTADHGDAYGEEGSWGHNPNGSNMEEVVLKSMPDSVLEIPYSRGVVQGNEVNWKDPADLEVEWEHPREAYKD